jgi:hypothetical protein
VPLSVRFKDQLEMLDADNDVYGNEESEYAGRYHYRIFFYWMNPSDKLTMFLKRLKKRLDV